MSFASKSDSARAFSILDAIGDKRLFGSAFKDPSTWRAWAAFLAALFALRLSGLHGPLWAS
jgi:N-acyl-D-aspartate/D-glutamate deacylase